MSNQSNYTPLSREKAQQIVTALGRFKELNGDGSIVNPRNEAELTGLKNYFAQSLFEHGNELVACWMVAAEYDQLLKSMANIFLRVQGMTQPAPVVTESEKV